jgi:hypothetical protein
LALPWSASTYAALSHLGRNSLPCLVQAFYALVVLNFLLQYACSIVGLILSPYLEI